MEMTKNDTREIFDMLAGRLCSERAEGGLWEGRLSSSALSTAVAVFALSVLDADRYKPQIKTGLSWLLKYVNTDGGWGDTLRSRSNISTTALCWSALTAGGNDPEVVLATRRAEEWLNQEAARLGVSEVPDAIISCYGGDRTFSSPILAMCALAGRFGEGEAVWRKVPQLAFEMAVLPRGLFRMLNLSVVSYALPALIAVGLLRHRKMPESSILRYLLRNSVTDRVLSLLSRIQPANGGFLEAVPLTAFVVMSLAGAGFGSCGVVEKGAGFILNSMRDDGSWPIDSNLSIWLTSLSVDALSRGGAEKFLTADEMLELRERLLGFQYKERHIYTGASPGGWSWTHLPGGVPDADDTSGVLIALRRLGELDERTRSAGILGTKWLMEIQNSDGGMPTFCRGWGKLPFDRSCPDITVHAMCALNEWYDDVDAADRARMDSAMEAGAGYLAKSQRDEGAWVPLWFGNENVPDGKNAVYGTARVVSGLRDLTPGRLPDLDSLIISGYKWLVSAQNSDGGWGGYGEGPSSIEETALALDAIAGLGDSCACERGLLWLSKATDGWKSFEPAPIGLYFASLWYFEKLYPLIFTVRALRQDKIQEFTLIGGF